MGAPITVENSIVIKRPRTQVYPYLVDPRNDPQWCPRVDNVQRVGAGQDQAGARYEITHRPFDPRRRTMTVSLHEVAPLEHVVLEEIDGGLQMMVTYRLADAADGNSTRLTQMDVISLPLPRVVAQMIVRVMCRAKRMQLQRLNEHSKRDAALRRSLRGRPR